MTQCLLTWLFPRVMMVNTNSSIWFLSLSKNVSTATGESHRPGLQNTFETPSVVTALKTHLHQHQLYLAEMTFVDSQGPQ